MAELRALHLSMRNVMTEPATDPLLVAVATANLLAAVIVLSILERLVILA